MQGASHQLFLPVTPWVIFPLAVVAIVGTANAVNLTDGMDGLAGGLSVIAVRGDRAPAARRAAPARRPSR